MGCLGRHRLIMLCAVLACAATACSRTTLTKRGKGGKPVASAETLEGGRAMSRNQRAAASMPKPWATEHGGFEEDRFGVEAYRAQTQGRTPETTRTVPPVRIPAASSRRDAGPTTHVPATH